MSAVQNKDGAGFHYCSQKSLLTYPEHKHDSVKGARIVRSALSCALIGPWISAKLYGSGNLISLFILWLCNEWFIFALDHRQDYWRRRLMARLLVWSDECARTTGKVMCWASNRRWSNGADKHGDLSMAQPAQPHVSRQECIAHCIVGLCLGGKSADSLTHRTPLG